MQHRPSLVLFALCLLLAATGCPKDKTSSGGGAGTGTTEAGSGADDNSDVLHGTLGDLGEIGPIVSSWVINNSGETLVYLSTEKVTCSEIMVSRWLGNVKAGTQVVEVVAKSKLATGTQKVGAVEVNYAPGGKSSAYEESATSGTVTFESCPLAGPCKGTVNTAKCDGGTCSVSGPFDAKFCDGGQGY